MSAGPKGNWELFDLQTDYGQQHDISKEQPEVFQQLKAAYDKWWDEARPMMVNEDVELAKENPFLTLYREQFGKVSQ